MLNQMNRRFVFIVGVAALASAIAGCTVHPPGERQERAAALAGGKLFERPVEERQLPALPEVPTADDLVRYAMLANADLENRYWQWRAALEQIPQDATQTATLNVALGSTVTRGRTSSGMNSVALGNDPMTDIKLPGKLDAAARVALENARAAGLRFRKAQFELRGKVLAAILDYALNAELIRLAEANQQLLETTALASEARNRAAAAGQQDVLKAKNEVDLGKNDVANMKAQFPAQRAILNALLGRPPNASLPIPEPLPEARPLTHDDAGLLALIAERNPELSALAAEASGRKVAVRLAELQYLPDFNLSVGTDLAGITQTLLGQATVPLLRHEALRAAVAQAQANLHGADAMRRQTANDLASQAVADLSTLRDADRQIELFGHTVLPRARQVVDVARASYETGHTTLLDLLDAQRTLISVERLVVNLRALRARRLIDLETIAAVDLQAAK